MPTRKPTSKKRARLTRETDGDNFTSAPSVDDAVTLLEADHRAVEDLFEKFEATADDPQKLAIAKAICMALKVHAVIEEDIFYPAAITAIPDQDLLHEALVEHAGIKNLIAQIEAGAPGDALYDARVKVLGEYVAHHVTEEETELFPQCRKSSLDLEAVGKLLATRQQALLAGMKESNPVRLIS